MKLIDGIYDEIIEIDTVKEYDLYLDILFPKGRKKLGAGCYGSVRECKDTQIAVKTGNADWNNGYLAFVKLARANQHNEFFPQIYWVGKFFEPTTGWSRFVVCMEKLQDGNKNNQWWDIANFVEDRVKRQDFDRKWNNLATPDTFKEAAISISSIQKKERVAFDLHSGNVMLRDGKQLVFTDPLV